MSSASPKEEDRPTDICTSGISHFKFSKTQLDVLDRDQKRNALLVNCTLKDVCGFTIPNPEVCPKI